MPATPPVPPPGSPLLASPVLPPTAHHANFSFAQLGAPDTWGRYAWQHPLFKRPTPGKFFLGELLQMTGAEISVNRFPAGVATPFYHTHRENEEIYLILSGKGEYSIDGRSVPLEPGTCLRIAPAGKRVLRAGPGEDLLYLCIQVRAGSGVSRYAADGEAPREKVSWEGLEPA